MTGVYPIPKGIQNGKQNARRDKQLGLTISLLLIKSTILQTLVLVTYQNYFNFSTNIKLEKYAMNYILNVMLIPDDFHK